MTDEDRARDFWFKGDFTQEKVLRLILKVRAEEAEACARLAENFKLNPRMGPAFAKRGDGVKIVADEIAIAIRVRHAIDPNDARS